MICSWKATAIEKCGKHATQVVLAICENGHISERLFCDVHASDWQEQVRGERRNCVQCTHPYLETEIQELHRGFKI